MIITGVYKERFTLRPSKKVSTKRIIKSVGGFYGKKGFTLANHREHSMAMEKDDKSIIISFSNYGSTIEFTVKDLEY